MKINRAVVAVFVSARRKVRHALRNRRLHRPPKRMNGTHGENWRATIPAGLVKHFAAILRRMGLERPSCVGSQLGRDTEFPKNLLRLRISRDDKGIAAISPAHPLDKRIHLAGFGPISDAEFILRRSNTQRADNHYGEGIREFALEHRAFASYHTIMAGTLSRQKRRIKIGQMQLSRVPKITARELEILSHHGKRKIRRIENAPHLPQNFFDAHVRSSISRPVVPCEKQFELLARSPGLARSKHPRKLLRIDHRANPGS